MCFSWELEVRKLTVTSETIFGSDGKLVLIFNDVNSY